MIVMCVREIDRGVFFYKPLKGRCFIVYSLSIRSGEIQYFLEPEGHPHWLNDFYFKIISNRMPTDWYFTLSQSLRNEELANDICIFGYEEMVSPNNHFYASVDSSFDEADTAIFNRRKKEINRFSSEFESESYRLAYPKGLWVEYSGDD